MLRILMMVVFQQQISKLMELSDKLYHILLVHLYMCMKYDGHFANVPPSPTFDRAPHVPYESSAIRAVNYIVAFISFEFIWRAFPLIFTWKNHDHRHIANEMNYISIKLTTSPEPCQRHCVRKSLHAKLSLRPNHENEMCKFCQK